ncbi:hypothetical protein HHI36_017173 [Cryptolaemus montrouzieri]|uniref:Cilia- and flagella-associated protein 157 n=1 Tax=Cryptolaemus montrouzieri TaxID=559131 RepID=A0ABD2NLS9_9CUCU
MLKEDLNLKSVIENEFEDEYKKIVEENENLKDKLKKMEEDCCENEEQMEMKIDEKIRMIGDLQIKLNARENQSRTVTHEEKRSGREDVLFDMVTQAVNVITRLNRKVLLEKELLEREERIETLQEEIEEQK